MDQIVEEVDGALTVESATHRGDKKVGNKNSSAAVRKMTSKDGRLNSQGQYEYLDTDTIHQKEEGEAGAVVKT